MLGPISQRILTLLQLTRMALVFTAISNGACEVLLQAGYDAEQNQMPFVQVLDARKKALIAMAAISIGLYGFGMSLNDIIDRRRDSRIAAYRPLPSGRIKLVTAYAICTCLALLAGWGGAAYARWTPHENGASASFALVGITALLIVFYDLAGKYLVAFGLVSLGMIRYLQASIAAPLLPIVWHPLLLLNHVTLLSAVAYHWEQKRPPLTRRHWRTIIGGLLLINLATVGFFAWRLSDHTLGDAMRQLQFNSSLLPVAATVLCFIGLAYWIRRQSPVPSDAGQKLMLYGLLWLIVYDAAFVGGYVSWTAAGILLCLLPIAWWSVLLMRWWSKVYSLSQKPAYQRVRA